MTIEPIAAVARACRSRAVSRARKPWSRSSAMGMEEGLTQAVGQIDAILAEDAVHSA